MNLSILISTYGAGISRIPNIIYRRTPNINYIISHQVNCIEEPNLSDDLSQRKDVSLSTIYSHGLSINRNNTIQMADGDICLIADDDVKYQEEDLLRIIDLFEKYPDEDILVGKIRTPDGQPFKAYKTNSYKINLLNVGSISSIEIAFRRNSIINKQLQFDDRFGIGGKMFTHGEEAVFLSDALKNNLSIRYVPFYFVEHPKESSGNQLVYDENEARYYGGLFYRIFGFKAYFLLPLLSIRHFKRYKKHISLFSFAKWYLKGIKEIRHIT